MIMKCILLIGVASLLQKDGKVSADTLHTELEEFSIESEPSSFSSRRLDDLVKRDCSKPAAKNSAGCFCRYPNNWETKKCQNKFWNTNYVQDNLDKVGRIVGGEDAPLDEYPWFARATWIGCGGMLVSPEFVLSAAHCMINGPGSGGWKIGAFEFPYQVGNNGGQFMVERSNSQVFQHPNYQSWNLQNDFALLKLNSPVTEISPVAMDQNQFSPNYDASKRNLWAIGLGTLSSGGPVPDKLKHVELAYITQSQCNSDYSGGIADNMMCAADPGQDSCQGDSGGPLFDKSNNVLVGVVSWGYGCADPNYPGVYSRVADQWTWIKETICDNSNTKPNYCGGTPPNPTPPPTPSPTPPTPNTPPPTPTTPPPTPNTPPPTPTTPPPTPSPTPSNCSGNEVSATVIIMTDDYPKETAWSIINQNTGQTIASVENNELDSSDTIYSESVCLSTSSNCYLFQITDAWGDGILSPGYYKVTVGGETFQGSDFGQSASHEFGSCDSVCPDGEKQWKLEFTTDNYGNEFKWQLRKRNPAGKFRIKVRKEKFGTYESNTSYSESACISADGCYKTIVVDKHGDGMCCSHGNGSYKVLYDGETIKNSSFQDVKREKTKKFGGGC